jgi:hypothetical protein
MGVDAAGDVPLPWQQPNNTEGTAWWRLQAAGVSGTEAGTTGAAYLPFPWASWIDAVARGLRPPEPPLRAGTPPGPVATVCQHIDALEHLPALRAAGVTDLFWSHTRRGTCLHEGVRLHPFPLLPVRCLSHPPPPDPIAPAARPLLYCFQGFQPPGAARSAVRRWLLRLPPRPDARLTERREWHFEQQVYREQVHGQGPDPGRHQQLAAEADAYVAALRDSCFALCPAGAGPNSIRLWEALGFGAIPVILSDQLRLPGEAALWEQAALFVPERAEAVAALPHTLAQLRGQPERLAVMQAAGRRLWRRYGPEGFVADVSDFLHDPDAVLRRRARQRLGGDGACEELVGREPAALLLGVRTWLRQAPRGARLLIHLEDQRPPELQERLWRGCVGLAAQLLAARSDVAWQLSCRPPRLEALAGPPLTGSDASG